MALKGRGGGECRWGRDGWIDGEKEELMREGAERRCLKKGDPSERVMNESMDTWVHIWIRGWMNRVNESIVKRVKVASCSSLKPQSNSNVLV